MANIPTIVTYIFLFISLNFEIFLLITYFERRGDMKEEENLVNSLKSYPTVAVIVPCWNEEKTISGTLHSLLNLDYPKNKLKIIAVDDGSTDGTWSILENFKNKNQIEIYKKENGGKHSALNLGLSKVNSDLVGCLDADSFVEKDALRHIVSYFQDKKVMAVAPSVKLWRPKGIFELLQKVEYSFGIFTRKMFHFMQAVYITPGPFSIFRREVFQKIGGYRHAHGTEDIDIALRMQKNHLKIAHAHKAIVHTVPPQTIKGLYKQRVRWSYGFVQNAFDHRELFFKKQYGNLGLLVLPMASISIISLISTATLSVYNLFKIVFKQYTRFEAIGFNFHKTPFDWFYINTQSIIFISIVSFFGILTILLLSRKMADGKFSVGMDLIYYLALYIFIAPIWYSKAIYNSIFSIETKWR